MGQKHPNTPAARKKKPEEFRTQNTFSNLSNKAEVENKGVYGKLAKIMVKTVQEVGIKAPNNRATKQKKQKSSQRRTKM